MMWTTVPSICLTLGIFLVIGYSSETTAAAADAESLSIAIADTFNLNPLLFIVPLTVIGMVVFKINALVALFVGTMLGGLFAIIFQPGIVAEVGGEGNYLRQSYVAVVNALATDIQIGTEDKVAAELLSAGGMAGMLNTIWLVICAMSFGGVMEATGLLKRITDPLVDLAKSTGSLVAPRSRLRVHEFYGIGSVPRDRGTRTNVPGHVSRSRTGAAESQPNPGRRRDRDVGVGTLEYVLRVSYRSPWRRNWRHRLESVYLYSVLFFQHHQPADDTFFAFVGIKIAKLQHGTDQVLAAGEPATNAR